MPTRLAAVVMAGGLGTRMRSALPKHLHPILGRRMVDWVLEAARPLGADPLVVVASPDTAAAFDGAEVAVQKRPLGTGDAVRSARDAVGDADRDPRPVGGHAAPHHEPARRPARRTGGCRHGGDGAVVRAGGRPPVRACGPERRR